MTTLGRAPALLSLLALLCSCARDIYRPSPGFVPKHAPSAELALVLQVEGSIPAHELDELARAFEDGVRWSFEARGYRLVPIERWVRRIDEQRVLDEDLDNRPRVEAERDRTLALAMRQRLAAVAVVRLQLHRVLRPFDGANTLATPAMRGYANYYVWAANEPLFYSETQTDANFMPVLSSFDPFGSRGDWFSYPHDVWARSMARRLLRDIPARASMRPERIERTGFRVPSALGLLQLPGARRDLALDLPGEETRYDNFQDRVGNALSTLTTNGVTWGYEIVPRSAHAYLLVDPDCSGRLTELWPTTAEAPVPVPACVRTRAPRRAR